jgi:hypothetical protein
MVTSASLLYFLPGLPIAPRLALAWRFRKFMRETLPEAERARSEHRTVILALTGFSFSGALALPAYGFAAQSNVLLPTFYVVLSFVCYLGALNVQGYKFLRWHDQTASGLADIATFSLILTVLGMILLLQASFTYVAFLAILSLLVWGVDLGIRLYSWISYFRAKEKYGSATT